MYQRMLQCADGTVLLNHMAAAYGTWHTGLGICFIGQMYSLALVFIVQPMYLHSHSVFLLALHL